MMWRSYVRTLVESNLGCVVLLSQVVLEPKLSISFILYRYGVCVFVFRVNHSVYLMWTLKKSLFYFLHISIIPVGLHGLWLDIHYIDSLYFIFCLFVAGPVCVCLQSPLRKHPTRFHSHPGLSILLCLRTSSSEGRWQVTTRGTVWDVMWVRSPAPSNKRTDGTFPWECS